MISLFSGLCCPGLKYVGVSLHDLPVNQFVSCKCAYFIDAYLTRSLSVINNIGACVMAIDAVCMALLATAALKWEGTERAKHSSTAVITLQLFSLFGELKQQQSQELIKLQFVIHLQCFLPTSRQQMITNSLIFPKLITPRLRCPDGRNSPRSALPNLNIAFVFRWVSDSFAALVVPVYLDAVTIVIGAIRSRLRKLMGKAGQQVRWTWRHHNLRM